MSSQVSLLIRILILSDHGPTLVTSFNLNYFLSPYIATLGWGRASMYEWGEQIHSVHNTSLIPSHTEIGSTCGDVAGYILQEADRVHHTGCLQGVSL